MEPNADVIVGMVRGPAPTSVGRDPSRRQDAGIINFSPSLIVGGATASPWGAVPPRGAGDQRSPRRLGA